jgi:hypothetical protein
MKLVERMARVCKAVIKAKGGYFDLICIDLYFDLYFDLFNPFLVTYVLLHSVDVFTIILQHRK